MFLLELVGKQTKLIKRIKKEILRVRRKLALQKGQRSSDLEESADTGLNIKSMMIYVKICLDEQNLFYLF